MLATVTATKPKKPPETGEHSKSLFAETGRAAAREAQKKLLLRVLKEHDWNMTAASEALGMNANTAVIRALKELAPEEYEEAKASGKISPANRR